MVKYFLGVDIGATKSHAMVADSTGVVLSLGIGGPGNYEDVGYDGLTSVLNAVTGEALAMAGVSKDELAGAGFGIGGYDWPAEEELTIQAIETLGLRVPFIFVNDTIIGLLAGSKKGWGIAVVSGTSNNCRGRDQRGREGRVTGAGPFMGEYGGAQEVVAKAVQAVSQAWAQRGPSTCLAEAFIELVGAMNVDDLLEGLILGRYELSPNAAPVVFQTAEAGDRVAQEIIRWAGQELGELVNGVIRQLGFEGLAFEVVLVGSMFKGSPLLQETLGATIYPVAPSARLVRLTAPPVVGGVLLGMEKAGISYPELRMKLIESTNELLKIM